VIFVMHYRANRTPPGGGLSGDSDFSIDACPTVDHVVALIARRAAHTLAGWHQFFLVETMDELLGHGDSNGPFVGGDGWGIEVPWLDPDDFPDAAAYDAWRGRTGALRRLVAARVRRKLEGSDGPDTAGESAALELYERATYARLTAKFSPPGVSGPEVEDGCDTAGQRYGTATRPDAATRISAEALQATLATFLANQPPSVQTQPPAG